MNTRDIIRRLQDFVDAQTIEDQEAAGFPLETIPTTHDLLLEAFREAVSGHVSAIEAGEIIDLYQKAEKWYRS